MADVVVEATAFDTFNVIALRAGPFWVSTTVAYIIEIDTSFDLVYRKTVNGGATWAAHVDIVTSTVHTFDAWADWQTEGDAGTKIHIAYIDRNSDDVRYVYLDTDGDSVDGDDEVEACQGTGQVATTMNWSVNMVSIAKSRGGNICIALRYQDSGANPFYGFYTSPDAVAWTSKASPFEAAADKFLLFPGNEADNQDMWLIFWDISENAISLKTFDNSGNSWAEQAILAAGDVSSYTNMDGQIRLSDGHLIFAAWNLYDNAAADLVVYDINGAGSITAKTKIINDESESFTVSVFINQVNDDIYVAYCSGTAALSLVKCFYDKSDDGGGTWDGETAMQADAEDDNRWLSAGCMKAANGGKFLPIWFDTDDNDIFCSTDNGISIAASAPPAGQPTMKRWGGIPYMEPRGRGVW